MASRIKAPTLKTRLEFETVIDGLARATVAHRKATARRDARLQAVREEHESDIAAIQESIDALALTAEKYADENRDELMPGKVKSAETSLATYGFRFGNPTLKVLSKSWTWERVVKELEGRLLAHFIRTTKEPDKEAMRLRLTPEQLAGVGCRVTQSETFYIEPKNQASDSRAV